MNSRARVCAAVATFVLLLAGCSGSDSTPDANAATPVVLLTWPDGMVNTEGPYPVTKVLDAQTIQLDRGDRGGLTTVRLLGSVPPDLSDEPRCYATEALSEVERRLNGQEVRIVADAGPNRLDPAGQPYVYVWLEGGRMLNDVLVEAGFAREAVGAQSYTYRENFMRSEELARTNGSGLWSPQTCNGNTAKAATGF